MTQTLQVGGKAGSRPGRLTWLLVTLAVTSGCAQDLGRWYADELKRVACSRGDRIQDCRYMTVSKEAEPES